MGYVAMETAGDGHPREEHWDRSLGHITIATKLYQKHITRLLPLALLLVLRTRNNTTATNSWYFPV